MRYSLTNKIAQYKLIYKTIIFEKKASDNVMSTLAKLLAKGLPRGLTRATRYVYNQLSSSDEPLVVPPPPLTKDNTFSNFFKSIPKNFKIDPKTLITGHPEESPVGSARIIRTAAPYSHHNLLSLTDKRQT